LKIECSGEQDNVEKVSREEGRKVAKQELAERWNMWRTCEISAFPGPGLMCVPMHASKNAASKMLDNSVDSCVFFTTRTVLECRDTGL
jgi:hypothetical protein